MEETMDEPLDARKRDFGMTEMLDFLATSSVGSRTFEVILRSCGNQRFDSIIRKWLMGVEIGQDQFGSRLCRLSCDGGSGNFVVSQILQSPFLTSEHLGMALQALDFQAILKSRTQGVIWRASEASRRLQSHHRECAAKLFTALDVAASQKFRLCWRCIIHLKTIQVVEDSLVKEDCDDEDTTGHHKRKKNQGGHLLLPLNPTGCSILINLIKFPPQTIGPLVQSFRSFLTQKEFVLSLGFENYGGRLLEAMVEPGSILDVKQIQKLIRIFTESFLALAKRSPFTITAFYRSSDTATKLLIARELAVEAASLCVSNRGVYTRCEIDLYLSNQELWTKSQERKSKARQMFEKVITPQDGAARTGAEGPPSDLDATAFEAITEAMNKGRKRNRKKANTESQETTGGDVAEPEANGRDPTWCAALMVIDSMRPMGLREEKRRKKEVARAVSER